MSDNKSKIGGQDKSRISLNEEYEVNYWKNKWGVTADELKKAVQAVGSEAKNVEEYLKNHHRK